MRKTLHFLLSVLLLSVFLSATACTSTTGEKDTTFMTRSDLYIVKTDKFTKVMVNMDETQVPKAVLDTIKKSIYAKEAAGVVKSGIDRSADVLKDGNKTDIENKALDVDLEKARLDQEVQLQELTVE